MIIICSKSPRKASNNDAQHSKDPSTDQFQQQWKAGVIKQVTTVLIREAPGPLWEASALETISEAS